MVEYVRHISYILFSLPNNTAYGIFNYLNHPLSEQRMRLLVRSVCPIRVFI